MCRNVITNCVNFVYLAHANVNFVSCIELIEKNTLLMLKMFFLR